MDRKLEKDRMAMSMSMLNRSLSLIPGATQTISKGYKNYIQGVAPSFIQKAKGCHFWDVDGNEFIDLPLALGSVTVGYADERINHAIECQLRSGISFSLSHPLEFELAEKLVELIPCAEMVRYGKNGSDVTSAAVRLSRAVTGRDIILCCGYHGWQDWYIGSTGNNRGVPKLVKGLTKTFKYNDIKDLERCIEDNKNDVACIIMEPVQNNGPQPGYLENVRKLADTYGIVLVFDEIVTGFRISMGGAQEYFKVIPDLTTIGKGMANGMPISAIVGKSELMKEVENIFYSFTNGGETLSIAASLTTIDILSREAGCEHAWRLGTLLKDGINSLANEKGLDDMIECVGMGFQTYIKYHPKGIIDALGLKGLCQQELAKRGVLGGGIQNICLAHTQADIEYVLSCYEAAFDLIVKAREIDDIDRFLEGGRPIPAFCIR